MTSRRAAIRCRGFRRPSLRLLPGAWWLWDGATDESPKSFCDLLRRGETQRKQTVDSILFADTAQLNGASRIGYAMFNDEISARAEMLRNEETVVCAYEITSVVPSLSLDINIL